MAKKVAKKIGKKEPSVTVRASAGGGAPIVVRKRGASELDKALAEVRSAYHPNTIRSGSDSPLYNCSPSGAFPLDYALMGGLPEGLATLIYGKEGSGKTTVTIEWVREVQIKYPDGMVLWVDAERTFDPEWARVHGVDLDRLMVVEPDDGNQAIDIVTRFLTVLDCVGIVVDSIPALVPKPQLERSAYDFGMAELARLVGILCSKSTSAWASERKRGHYVSMILINQLRSAMNARLAHATRQPGGSQLQYFVTTRIKLTGREVRADELTKKAAQAMGLAVPEDKKDKAQAKVEFVEHSFELTKAKIGSGLREGEFRMNVNPAHPSLRVGEYDNAKLAMLFAKRAGMLRGSAGRYYLHGVNTLPAWEGTFKSYADMELWLCATPEALLLTQRLLIAALRLHYKKPLLPPDKYLLGFVKEKDLEAAHEFGTASLSPEEEAEAESAAGEAAEEE